MVFARMAVAWAGEITMLENETTTGRNGIGRFTGGNPFGVRFGAGQPQRQETAKQSAKKAKRTAKPSADGPPPGTWPTPGDGDVGEFRDMLLIQRVVGTNQMPKPDGRPNGLTVRQWHLERLFLESPARFEAMLAALKKRFTQLTFIGDGKYAELPESYCDLLAREVMMERKVRWDGMAAVDSSPETIMGFYGAMADGLANALDVYNKAIRPAPAALKREFGKLLETDSQTVRRAASAGIQYARTRYNLCLAKRVKMGLCRPPNEETLRFSERLKEEEKAIQRRWRRFPEDHLLMYLEVHESLLEEGWGLEEPVAAHLQK
jgi:hypothetical protein